jgi:hypothetical protein
MDRGRVAREGQKPTAPTTRLIRGYSRINAYCATQLSLRSTRARAEVLAASLHLDARCRGGTEVELRMPSTGDGLSGGKPN